MVIDTQVGNWILTSNFKGFHGRIDFAKSRYYTIRVLGHLTCWRKLFQFAFQFFPQFYRNLFSNIAATKENCKNTLDIIIFFFFHQQ